MIDPVRAIDISNYLSPSANDDYAGFVDWVGKCRDEGGVRLFIVQGINPPANYPKGQTFAQCKGVLEAGGVLLAGYVYPFFGNGPNDCAPRLAQFDPFKDQLVDMFLDLEDTTSPLNVAEKSDIIDAWLEDCDAYRTSEAGIYTGEGVWKEMGLLPNYTRWQNRNCWWAGYDGNQDIDTSKATCGGFKRIVLHQFIGSASLFGYAGLDGNVVNLDYLASLEGDNMPPVPQEYQDKFGCSANDWPCVAANLEGIIHELQSNIPVETNRNDTDTVKAVQDVLKAHGY